MGKNTAREYLNQFSNDMRVSGNKTVDKGKEDARSYQQGKFLKVFSRTISFKDQDHSSLTITRTLESGAMVRKKPTGNK